MARYGIPYQGSKSRIATWIVEQLPASHTLVDIFAGGCAVTHAALLSGKWDNIIANDISDAPDIFLRAIRGEFADYCTVPTREAFKASDDDVIKLLYSFSNIRRTYLWGEDIEPMKVAACKMLTLPTLAERRKAYMTFCRELRKFIDNGGEVTVEKCRLQALEGLQRLQDLEELQGLQALEGLQTLSCDYHNVAIPDGATVYADPPYVGTDNRAYSEFDHAAFEAWLAEVPFPVYVSEYSPPAGCVAIASRERICSASQTKTDSTTELLCVQERFAR